MSPGGYAGLKKYLRNIAHKRMISAYRTIFSTATLMIAKQRQPELAAKERTFIHDHSRSEIEKNAKSIMTKEWQQQWEVSSKFHEVKYYAGKNSQRF